MYRFYMARGSSALAAHILLEETCAPYETEILSIPEKDHLKPAYLAINPRGRIPALQTPRGVISENPAILAFLAQAHPEKSLAPSDAYDFAQAQSVNLFLAATMHPAFAHKLRGARYADTKDAIDAMKAKVPQNIAEGARLIENHLLKGPWVLGDHFSMCDAYMFLVHRWMGANDVPLGDYPKLAAHTAAMKNRPSVQTVLEYHRI